MICLFVLRLLGYTEASGNTYVPLQIIFFGQIFTGGVVRFQVSAVQNDRAVCSQGLRVLIVDCSSLLLLLLLLLFCFVLFEVLSHKISVLIPLQTI